MSLLQVVSHDARQAAREAVVTKETAATKMCNALNVERMRLPMVKVEKDYTCNGRSHRNDALSRVQPALA